MKNLVIICGGVSPEHEISLRSAKNIIKALDKSKYQVHVVGISKAGQWFKMEVDSLGSEIPETGSSVSLKPGSKNCFYVNDSSLGEVDVIFPVLHGPNGEDGSVQGLIQVLDIPCVGPGVIGSAVSMDKEIAKRLLRAEGIQVADWMLIRKGDTMPSYEEAAKKLGDVMFVKPANMGSSVGVARVANENEWGNAIEDAFKYDDKILIEKRLVGRELECAVLGNDVLKASGVGEVQSGEVYSFDEKYADSSSAKITIPAEVSNTELGALKNTAINAYKALECKGLSRVDMFLDESGNVFVNEINTMPGFTSISMYPKLWMNEGMSYSQLIDELIELAISNHG